MWNDRLTDEEFETVTWLESFPTHGDMLNEWPEGPSRVRPNHALVDLYECIPFCAVEAEKWTRDMTTFPTIYMRRHECCIDKPVLDGNNRAGGNNARLDFLVTELPWMPDNEVYYSEEYNEWQQKKPS